MGTIKKNKSTFLTVIIILAMAGCASQPTPNSYDPPGFFMAFVHGYLFLFSLIGGVFTDTRIYAFPNSGGWYDFGYVLGVLAFVGTSASAAD